MSRSCNASCQASKRIGQQALAAGYNPLVIYTGHAFWTLQSSSSHCAQWSSLCRAGTFQVSALSEACELLWSKHELDSFCMTVCVQTIYAWGLKICIKSSLRPRLTVQC